ncbi:MAG: hypothetical protein QGH45_18250, partial [Myxococcota bacterium]|nr:hypothetical protein [Myxococcota bacterium]
LFDLASDPGETTDIANGAMTMFRRQELEGELEAILTLKGMPQLDAEVGAAVEGGAPEMDEAMKAQLRALGYIE